MSATNALAYYAGMSIVTKVPVSSTESYKTFLPDLHHLVVVS